MLQCLWDRKWGRPFGRPRRHRCLRRRPGEAIAGRRVSFVRSLAPNESRGGCASARGLCRSAGRWEPPGCAVGCRERRPWLPAGFWPIRHSLPAENSLPQRSAKNKGEENNNKKMQINQMDASASCRLITSTTSTASIYQQPPTLCPSRRRRRASCSQRLKVKGRLRRQVS